MSLTFSIKTWIGVKSVVPMKPKNNKTPSLIINDEKCSNDPIIIPNTFNDFFTSISETVQSKITFSNKCFRNVLSTSNIDSFVITFPNKEQIYKIISYKII